MKIKLTIFLLISLLGAKISMACLCDYEGEFLKVAPSKPLVALVKFIEAIPDTIHSEKFGDISVPYAKLEIVEVYKGSEERKIIKIWGDYGFLCRGGVPRDTTKLFIVAFDKCGDGPYNEKPEDYSVSHCGEYYVEANIQSNYFLSGKRGEEKEIFSLDILKKTLATR